VTDFEIHGDNVNGITISWGDTKRQFEVYNAEIHAGPVSDRPYHWAAVSPMPYKQIITFDVHEIREPKNPEVTSEGIWLH
jgi:hypothetical protein